MSSVYITVFTPAYNRAHTLSRLYNSLTTQSFKIFEWIIVDDGSIDETSTLVSEFIKEGRINITYHLQQNSGKHFAINKGIELSKGELFFIVDSDDMLTSSSLMDIAHIYEENRHLNKISGVAGRRAYFDGSFIGSKEEFTPIFTNALDIRYGHKVKGDLAEVFLTSVLKEFPFPNTPGERYCSESLVWNRIAQQYNMMYFSKSIYLCEYLSDGLTANTVKIRVASPLNAIKGYSELVKYNIPFIYKIRSGINFWRFAFYANISFWEKMDMIGWGYSIIGIPIGFLMYSNDRRNISKDK